MNRKDKEVKDMRQVHLTPLSAVVDEVWGEKGSPHRDAMERRLRAETGKTDDVTTRSPVSKNLSRVSRSSVAPTLGLRPVAPVDIPPKNCSCAIFLGEKFGKPKIILTFASSVLAKPLHNAQIVRGVFCLCPFAHGRSYGLCQTAWIPQNIGILGKSEKACQLRKKVLTSERSCSSVKRSTPTLSIKAYSSFLLVITYFRSLPSTLHSRW